MCVFVLIFFLQSSFSDPRTREWPMMSSPFPTLAVCLTYAYCVKVSHFSYVLYLHFIHVFFFFWAIFLFYYYYFILLLHSWCTSDYILHLSVSHLKWYTTFHIMFLFARYWSLLRFIFNTIISTYLYAFIKPTMPRSVRMSVREKAKSVYGIFKVFSAISWLC